MLINLNKCFCLVLILLRLGKFRTLVLIQLKAVNLFVFLNSLFNSAGSTNGQHTGNMHIANVCTFIYLVPVLKAFSPLLMMYI